MLFLLLYLFFHDLPALVYLCHTNGRGVIAKMAAQVRKNIGYLGRAAAARGACHVMQATPAPSNINIVIIILFMNMHFLSDYLVAIYHHT